MHKIHFIMLKNGTLHSIFLKVIKQEDQISTSNSNCACETKSHYQSSLPNLHYLALYFN